MVCSHAFIASHASTRLKSGNGAMRKPPHQPEALPHRVLAQERTGQVAEVVRGVERVEQVAQLVAVRVVHVEHRVPRRPAAQLVVAEARLLDAIGERKHAG